MIYTEFLEALYVDFFFFLLIAPRQLAYLKRLLSVVSEGLSVTAVSLICIVRRCAVAYAVSPSKGLSLFEQLSALITTLRQKFQHL